MSWKKSGSLLFEVGEGVGVRGTLVSHLPFAVRAKLQIVAESASGEEGGKETQPELQVQLNPDTLTKFDSTFIPRGQTG